MARMLERVGERRRRALRRAGERGAQALEYMALGTMAVTTVAGIGVALHGHSAEIGGAVVNQIKTGLGQ